MKSIKGLKQRINRQHTQCCKYALLNIAYPVTRINNTIEGITTILAISSYSISSVVSATMPINMIMLKIPVSTGFITWTTYLVAIRSFKKLMVLSQIINILPILLSLTLRLSITVKLVYRNRLSRA